MFYDVSPQSYAPFRERVSENRCLLEEDGPVYYPGCHMAYHKPPFIDEKCWQAHRASLEDLWREHKTYVYQGWIERWPDGLHAEVVDRTNGVGGCHFPGVFADAEEARAWIRAVIVRYKTGLVFDYYGTASWKARDLRYGFVYSDTWKSSKPKGALRWMKLDEWFAPKPGGPLSSEFFVVNEAESCIEVQDEWGDSLGLPRYPLAKLYNLNEPIFSKNPLLVLVQGKTVEDAALAYLNQWTFAPAGSVPSLSTMTSLGGYSVPTAYFTGTGNPYLLKIGLPAREHQREGVWEVRVVGKVDGNGPALYEPRSAAL